MQSCNQWICLLFTRALIIRSKFTKHLEERLPVVPFVTVWWLCCYWKIPPNVDMMKKNRSNQLITQYYTGQLPWYIGSTRPSQWQTNQRKRSFKSTFQTVWLIPLFLFLYEKLGYSELFLSSQSVKSDLSLCQGRCKYYFEGKRRSIKEEKSQKLNKKAMLTR